MVSLSNSELFLFSAMRTVAISSWSIVLIFSDNLLLLSNILNLLLRFVAAPEAFISSSAGAG